MMFEIWEGLGGVRFFQPDLPSYNYTGLLFVKWLDSMHMFIGHSPMYLFSPQCLSTIPWLIIKSHWYFNSLRPRQNRRHFADNVFKCNFLNENVCIPIKISLKFVSKGPINNIPALVQIMAWRWTGDKPLSEPMMTHSMVHICVTWPQWVKGIFWVK